MLHCLYWKLFSADIHRKFNFYCLLLFQFNNIYNVYLFMFTYLDIYSLGLFMLPFRENSVPTTWHFLRFFYLVCKLSKFHLWIMCLILDLFRYVDCVYWVGYLQSWAKPNVTPKNLLLYFHCLISPQFNVAD